MYMQNKNVMITAEPRDDSKKWRSFPEVCSHRFFFLPLFRNPVKSSQGPDDMRADSDGRTCYFMQTDGPYTKTGGCSDLISWTTAVHSGQRVRKEVYCALRSMVVRMLEKMEPHSGFFFCRREKWKIQKHKNRHTKHIQTHDIHE
ncbi:hypothetical protein GDO78_004755 [Eleutherodactylus coqui]|uniref:Uncharacterized protein n=1 Tax=Eleutherodactylus coqui TaxID=57060 RepID=A0A8J6K063_ELECQ|nr:hypothetical protein GDO78_004755 [Eleutherodactylus coqui]